MQALKLSSEISSHRERRGLIRKTFFSSIRHVRFNFCSHTSDTAEDPSTLLPNQPRRFLRRKRPSPLTITPATLASPTLVLTEAQAEARAQQASPLYKNSTPATPVTPASPICPPSQTSEGQSKLYALPTELLLQICTHLAPTDFASLSQTSRPLNTFITTSTATLTNNLILHHFALEAKILQSVMLNGWLVPSHPVIAAEENRASLPRSRSITPPTLHLHRGEGLRSRKSSEASTCKHTPTTSPRLSLKQRSSCPSKLSQPGPQYHQFLQTYSLEIRTYAQMYLYPPRAAPAIHIQSASTSASSLAMPYTPPPSQSLHIAAMEQAYNNIELSPPSPPSPTLPMTPLSPWPLAMLASPTTPHFMSTIIPEEEYEDDYGYENENMENTEFFRHDYAQGMQNNWPFKTNNDEAINLTEQLLDTLFIPPQTPAHVLPSPAYASFPPLPESPRQQSVPQEDSVPHIGGNGNQSANTDLFPIPESYYAPYSSNTHQMEEPEVEVWKPDVKAFEQQVGTYCVRRFLESSRRREISG